MDLDGGELRYRAQRKLGGLWWVRADSDLSTATGPLGPDAAHISWKEFRERVGHRRGAIKARLMDQELLAGIGNELSDEILWQARIRPDVPVQHIRERQPNDLHRTMHDVLRCSMQHGRIPNNGQWLNAVRGEDQPKCPRCRAA